MNNEVDYSKRELDDHFNDVTVKIGEVKISVDNLNDKVAIQNGRVARLETKWNGVVMAGCVLIFLIGLIISLVVYSFNLAQENLRQSILLEINTQ